jgi:hypothetical protein
MSVANTHSHRRGIMRQIYAETLATPYAQQSRASSGSRWVLVTVCLAVLLAQVDTSVVNLALRSRAALPANRCGWMRRVWC